MVVNGRTLARVAAAIDQIPRAENVRVRGVAAERDPADPGGAGIDGSLSPPQGRGPDPEHSGNIRRREVPSLLQLEHSPVTAAVVVAVHGQRAGNAGSLSRVKSRGDGGQKYD
jgi:hypothetical protein